MQYCQACAARRTGTSKFCEQCGEAFPADEREGRSRAIPWVSLGWAGPLPLVFFLLPWITVSCQTMPVSQSFTGLTLATGFTVPAPFGPAQRVPGEPVLFLVPLAAALFGILFWLGLRVREADTATMLASAIGVAGLGLAVMIFKYIQWATQIQRETGGAVYLSPAVGSILSLLAFVAAGVGAWRELVEYRRRAVPAAARIATPAAAPAVKEWGASAVAVNDGPPFVLQFCTACGARAPGGSRFCVECGQLLIQTGESASA